MREMSRWQVMIDYRAAVAQAVIAYMADNTMLAIGFTQEYVNRSLAQKRRRAKQQEASK